MAQAHSTRQRQVQCRQPGCNRLFYCKKEMEQHRLDSHSGQRNSASSPTSRIMAQAISARQRQVQCRQPGCNRLFYCKKEMEQHRLASHSGQRTSASSPTYPCASSTTRGFACNDCPKRFRVFTCLQQHAAANPGTHMQVGRAAHSRCCVQCPRENFATIEDLERHRAASHPVEELSADNSDRQEVEAYFRRKWLDQSLRKPTILSVLRVYNETRRVGAFENYRRSIKVKANECPGKRDENSIKDGNEVRRFHGTAVHCSLGLNSSGLCNSGECSLCSILRNGFRLKKVRVDAFQRFGLGIYCTATSSKAHAYVRAETGLRDGKKAMIVCRALAGRAYQTKMNLLGLNKPPPGFDSVVGEPGVHLNYDELVLYDDRSILPRYIIIYTCS